MEGLETWFCYIRDINSEFQAVIKKVKKWKGTPWVCYCWLCSLTLSFFFYEKMKNLVLERNGCVAQSMQPQYYRFYSDLAQVHQGKLTLAAYSVTKSWYFSGLIHNITVSYCCVFIFPIHFSHFQSMLICDPGSLATIIGIFLGPKGNKFLIHHTFLISEKQQVTWLIPFLIFFSFWIFLIFFPSFNLLLSF